MSTHRLKRAPRERDVERVGTETARKHDVLHLKFVSPGRTSVPDRLVLAKIPEFLRDTIARYVRFIEYKRPGEVPTPPQEREHARLRAMGFQVDVIDNTFAAEFVVGNMGDGRERTG